ncbi:phosphatidylserine/phosphatidylglycerophosphate/cardiolipin synthase family protein [Fluviicola sp.]|uniref:phospholipase D-like domain-containing protein n=1 Tax=Fluviicola sp. TaxID=1917219 RepID=UPI0026046FEA|nr:phospholipase D-like domain-containing protein [Fluviicola sp.]
MIKTHKSVESIELVHSGEDYFSRLKTMISNAQNEVHFQTYIFDNDSTGLEIVEALKEAAARKVKVFVLLDGYGSFKLPKTIFRDLVKHGISIRFFSPWYSINNFYVGRRLHHKVIVADGEVALIGGINIADKYRGSDSVLPWLDYAVQINGAAFCKPLQQLCGNIYSKENKLRKRSIISRINNDKGAVIKLLRNDWLNQKNEISNAYLSKLRKADKEVIVVASYFLPGRKFSKVLKRAAKRGVKIKIILSGVSDLPIVMRATRYLYSSLLEQGIELLEWNKSVLHGKLALVDDTWSTIGSFNINHLSSYGSIEMNVEINSSKLLHTIDEHLRDVIEQCETVTFETIKSRWGIIESIKNWMAYFFVRIALVIATYLPYKRFGKFY